METGYKLLSYSFNNNFFSPYTADEEVNIILVFVFFLALSMHAQEVVKEIEKVTKAVEDTTRTHGWTKNGEITFLLNQSSFSNWVAGGENSFSGNIGLNYDLNYKSEDWSCDNKIIASYGLLQTQNAEFEKKKEKQQKKGGLRIHKNSVII